MDERGIPKLSSPLLYVFEGELIRIRRFIKEHLQYVQVFAGCGHLYGLYTHSRGAVVHLTTLTKLNERELRDAMSSRVEVADNEYRLSLIGEWLTVQNIKSVSLSVRELLQKKASTLLNESETYFCIVVDKLRSIEFNSNDISDLTINVYFLLKGKVYKLDMKILRRESPFRFDPDLTEKISRAEHIGDSANDDEEFCSKGFENFGTEMKDLSPRKSKTDTALSNSENPLEHNENGQEVDHKEADSSPEEIENGHDIGPAAEKCQEIENGYDIGTDEATVIDAEKNTKKKDDELEIRDRRQKETGLVPAENGTGDIDTLAENNSNDVDIPNPSLTEETPIQTIFSGDEKTDNVDRKEAESLPKEIGDDIGSTAENSRDIVTDEFIPQLSSPLLYVFEGELIRIRRFIEEHSQSVQVLTDCGHLYGLYTHSRGAVVHLTTLTKLNERQLRDAMSSRVEVADNEYRLSLIGEWLTVQNMNISVRELLPKKASTLLDESETYFYIVVDKQRSKFNPNHTSDLTTNVYFLLKGKIYKLDMKILGRESPFRLDTDFTDKISSAEHIGDSANHDEEFCSKGFENVRSEINDLSPQIAKTDTALSNSENPLEHNENGQEVSILNETENRSQDPPVGNNTEENSDKEAQPVLPTKELSTEATFIGAEENTREKDSELETRDRGQKETGLVPAENRADDIDAWVVIDSNVPNPSTTEETPIQTIFSGDEKTDKVDHKEADSKDDKQREAFLDSSVPENNSTAEIEDNITCGVAQRSEENDNKENEDVKEEDSQVANEKRLPDVEASATTVSSDEERKIMDNERKISAADGDEGMNCSPKKIENGDDIGPTAENGRDIGTDEFETAENEMINENKENSVTKGKDNDEEDEKPQEFEIGKNKNIESGELEKSTEEPADNHDPFERVDNVQISVEPTDEENLSNEENDNKDVREEDSQVANEKRLPDEEASTTKVSSDEERKRMENEGEINVADGDEEMNCSPKEIKNGDDIGPTAENGYDIGTKEFERATAENKMIDGNKENSVTKGKDNDQEDKKPQESEKLSDNVDNVDNVKTSVEPTDEENLSKEGTFDDTSVTEPDKKTSENMLLITNSPNKIIPLR